MFSLRRALAYAIAPAVVGCAGSETPLAPSASFTDFGLQAPATAPLTPLERLVIPTYEGSGEAVHPDVLWFPDRWHGWEYWMAFTPYPSGHERYENPSIVVSHDGKAWQVPAGLRNPIVPQPRWGGYNSDPDLSYDAANNRLTMLTREVRGGYNTISILFSGDGVRWTRPRIVFRRKNHGMISPTLAMRPDLRPVLWYVDGGSKKCPRRVTQVTRQDVNGPPHVPVTEKGWGAPQRGELIQPGYHIWHLDVAWVPARREYWAVYPAYDTRGCGARDLFFARSRDRITWTTYRTPLLRHEDERWTSATLYRASALYDPSRDAMRLYLSAATSGPDWRLGVVEFKLSDLLARLEGTASGQPGLGRLRRPDVVIAEDSLP